MLHFKTWHDNSLFPEIAHIQYGKFLPTIELVASAASTLVNLARDLKLVWLEKFVATGGSLLPYLLLLALIAEARPSAPQFRGSSHCRSCLGRCRFLSHALFSVALLLYCSTRDSLDCWSSFGLVVVGSSSSCSLGSCCVSGSSSSNVMSSCWWVSGFGSSCRSWCGIVHRTYSFGPIRDDCPFSFSKNLASCFSGSRGTYNTVNHLTKISFMGFPGWIRHNCSCCATPVIYP